MYIDIRLNINQHGCGTDMHEMCKQESVFITMSGNCELRSIISILY